jgi:hypothetical protein
VFSTDQVVAAQALPNGQVVVVLADGTVNLLVPRGIGLSVGSELLAQGAAPASPSAIEVVSKPSGQFDVLVSSQGSDTLSVFAEADISSGTVAPPGGGSSPASSSFQSTAATTTQFVVLTTSTIATGATQAAVSSSASVSASSGSLSATATSAMGLSLGSFSSLGNGSAPGPGEAILVPVKGNNYLSVPILGFGSENGEEVDNGEGGTSWLSSLHPFGDTSPLTRFVIGLDEALRDYRGWEEEPSLRNEGHSHDPWNEDLFHRHLPVQPRILGQDENDARKAGSPGAMLRSTRWTPLQDDRGAHGHLGDERFSGPLVRHSSQSARVFAGFKALAGLFAAIPLTLAMSGFDRRKTDLGADTVPAKAARNRESSTNLPSREAD